MKKKVMKKDSVKEASKDTSKTNAKELKEHTKKTVKKSTKKDVSLDIVKSSFQVSVEYTGSLDNGEVFDSSTNHGPLVFVVGSGQVIKGFDNAVLGMKLNEEKTVKIAKNEAYGDVNNDLVREFPISMIPEHIRPELKIDGFLMMQTPYGQQVPTRITKIGSDKITLDLNHPLAGKDLTFKIKVVHITDKPEESSCGDECGCGHDEDKDSEDSCCGGSCGCNH